MEDLGGRVALRVSFLKAGAELSGPLFVCGHFCTPHNVCSCYALRGIQVGEMGYSIFSTKNFKSLKKSTFWKKIVNNRVLCSNKAGKKKMSSVLEWKWNYADDANSNWKSKFGEYYSEFYHSDYLFPSSSSLKKNESHWIDASYVMQKGKKSLFNISIYIYVDAYMCKEPNLLLIIDEFLSFSCFLICVICSVWEQSGGPSSLWRVSAAPLPLGATPKVWPSYAQENHRGNRNNPDLCKVVINSDSKESF